jgi:hypothetical protein
MVAMDPLKFEVDVEKVVGLSHSRNKMFQTTAGTFELWDLVEDHRSNTKCTLCSGRSR